MTSTIHVLYIYEQNKIFNSTFLANEMTALPTNG